ncbi:MAG: triose-phosphate isomerase [Pseudomonadota bacterium]
MTRRMMAAGNWKMNGGPGSLVDLRALCDAHPNPDCDVLICPPAPLIAGFVQAGLSLNFGAQDCHPDDSGAHTGDTSAAVLAEVGAVAVIVGHSERRADHAESSALVAAKAQAAWRAGLSAIICIGETLDDRDAGRTLEVVAAQLAHSVPNGATATNTVIAYEPVWAIGTGRTPSLDDIAQVHGAIRADLATRFGQSAAAGLRVLYGGSVKPGNAAEIFGLEDVDGGLVGGASLQAEDFGPIIAAASAS